MNFSANPITGKGRKKSQSKESIRKRKCDIKIKKQK